MKPNLVSMMLAMGGFDDLYYPSKIRNPSEKSKLEKRIENQITKKTKEDNYPDIELTIKEKRKCKCWADIQEMKRLKKEAKGSA